MGSFIIICVLEPVIQSSLLRGDQESENQTSLIHDWTPGVAEVLFPFLTKDQENLGNCLMLTYIGTRF